MTQAKLAAILSLLFLVIFAVMTIVLMHKKRNRQAQPAHGTPHGAGGHGAGHGGAHAHTPPSSWFVFQFVIGGPIIWMDWGGHCDKAGKFWPRILMLAFCLINLFFWRNTGTPYQYVFWGILIALFVWLAIAGRECAKSSHWHLEAHYWDRGSEWVVATVMGWGFFASISWFFLAVIGGEISKEEVKQERRAELKVRVAKDATASKWTWVHYLPNGMLNGKPNEEVVFLVWNTDEITIQIPEEHGSGNTTLHYKKGDELWSWRSSTGAAQGWVKTDLTAGGIIPPFEGITTFAGTIDNWEKDSSGNWRIGVPKTNSTGRWSIKKGEALWEHRKGTY